jgi:hypothetical protein
LTVDLAGLEAVGWGSQTGVLTVDPSHRLLGYELCTAAGCRSEARVRDGLCEGCAKRRRAGPASDIEAFRAIEIDGAQWPGEQLCLVFVHELQRDEKTAAAKRRGVRRGRRTFRAGVAPPGVRGLLGGRL